MFSRSLRTITRRTFVSSAAFNQEAKSSCVAGTVLNLKIKKSGDEPIALEDKDYPEWLWDCLDNKKLDDQLKQTDFLKWKKKQIGKANTQKIKDNNFLTKM